MDKIGQNWICSFTLVIKAIYVKIVIQTQRTQRGSWGFQPRMTIGKAINRRPSQGATNIITRSWQGYQVGIKR